MSIKPRIKKLFGVQPKLSLESPKMPAWFAKAMQEVWTRQAWENPVIRKRFFDEMRTLDAL